MALFKEIELSNGVTVNYHRVVRVNTVTNVNNIIEVASYTSQSKRGEEKNAIANAQPMSVFIDTNYFVAPYDQTMTVEGAYNWVKENIDKFEDAEDILE